MLNLGDRAVSSTLSFLFNTHKADGTPITLAGTPVISVYKNSTTESTSGVTLTVDYDSRTGMHQVIIDTSADGTFYATGNDFNVVITTGTVNSISVVGSVVAKFSIGRQNISHMNSIAASSVTTINANQGTTQPLNFTGTAGSALVKSDMVDVAGAAVSTATAQIGVNAVNIGGTAQTGRDVGASVLLSPGTGTGQLDITSGVVKSNLVQILTAAITGTAANLVASFTKFFDIAVPTGTVNSLPDAVAGANNGLPTTNGTKLNQTVDLTAGQSIACSDKTGFSLTATGLDLVIGSTTFVTNLVTAIWSALTSAYTSVTGSFGKKLADWVVGNITANQAVNVAQWGGQNIATPAINGEPVVTLDATQAAYAPAKAGDAMALTSGERTSTGTAVWATTVRALTDKIDFALLTSQADAIGSDAAGKVLATPAYKLVTDLSGRVTVGTNEDKAGYSISGTKQTLDALNDVSTTQVNTEVDTALSDIDLDHLSKVGSAPTPTVGSNLDKIMNKNGSQTFSQSTDALEAIADAMSGSGLTVQQVRDAMKLDASAGAPASGSIDKHLDDIQTQTDKLNFTGTDVKATLDSEQVTVATNNDKTGYLLLTSQVDAIGTDAAGKILVTPAYKVVTDSSGRVTVGTNADKAGYSISGTKQTLDALNDVSAATVNSEVDTALADIDLDHLSKVGSAPTPTVGSNLDKVMNKDGSQTFSQLSDSLEGISDTLSTSGLTQQQVRDSMKLAPTAGAPAAGSVDKHLDDIQTNTDLIPTYQVALLTAIESIQNNTSFVGVVPSPIMRPETGSKSYDIYVRLFDDVGNPEDPDSNIITLVIKDESGAIVVPPTNMTRTGVGQYKYVYIVYSADTARILNVFFDYIENLIPLNQVRTTEVISLEEAAILNDILAGVEAIVAKLPLNAIADQTLLAAAIADIETILSTSGVTLSTSSKEYIKDMIITRMVLTRHPNDKPKTYEAGTGPNLTNVRTTIDGNGNIDTEVII